MCPANAGALRPGVRPLGAVGSFAACACSSMDGSGVCRLSVALVVSAVVRAVVPAKPVRGRSQNVHHQSKYVRNNNDLTPPCGERIEDLDQRAEKLHDAVAEVENLPTRRVDWVIRNVSKRIRPPSASKARPGRVHLRCSGAGGGVVVRRSA